ncbi:MAG: hypothetical protein KF764_03535 [Labilithrix sp.]|nr:hypothetical protein [Labilithrix sp.]
MLDLAPRSSRHALALLVAFASAVALLVSEHGSAAAGPSPATSGSPADLLTLARGPAAASPETIGACAPAEREKGVARFGFAHFGDLHARYGELLGGHSRYGYIAGFLKQLKEARPTLVLDAGGDYERGSLAEVRSSGEATRQLVQALPIDARTIGRSDFAYGETAVLRDARLSRHPVLAANVMHADLPASAQPFRPYARFDVGCAKVGVIGLVTGGAGADGRPTKAPYDGVFVHDDRYLAILEREAKAYRAEVDVLVALTHLGQAEDLALARGGGKLVDLVVGAGSGDRLAAPVVVRHPDGTKTWVMQAGPFGQALGRGEVVVKLGAARTIAIEGYGVVDIDEALPHASEVSDLARRIEDAVAPDAHASIGRLSAPVERRAVSELVWRAAAATWRVDAMVVGRDLGQAKLPKGDVTLQRLYDAVLGQRQPAGTAGSSSIWIAELGGAEMSAIARVFRPGTTYDWFGPRSKFDPTRRYRLALDKRAATNPKVLFGPESRSLRPALVGEAIDALEPYARARAARGQSID